MRIARKSDTSAIMLMINTILFGVGLGLVAISWIEFVQVHDTRVNLIGAFLSFQHPLMLITVAVLAGGFFHSVTVLYPELMKQEQEKVKSLHLADDFRDQAHRDPLTGLHNRRYFDHSIEAYFSEFSSLGSSFGLLILDLDHFKKVNDTFGHDAGDVVLKEVALRMRSMAREHDIVARLGGEEFAIVAPFANRKELEKIAERYRQQIGALVVDYNGTRINPTVSVGVACNKDVEKVTDLLNLADSRLYQAKRMGRNRIAA